MRALTLWQPWASAIALGLKRVETRPTWASALRRAEGERIAIHAAQRAVSPNLWIGRAYTAQGGTWLHVLDGPSVRLPFGAVVATAVVGAVVPTGNVKAATEDRPNCTEWRQPAWGPHMLAVSDDERAWGDYTPGRYAIVMEDVVALETPVPARGRQRLWYLDQDDEDAVVAQIGARR